MSAHSKVMQELTVRITAAKAEARPRTSRRRPSWSSPAPVTVPPPEVVIQTAAPPPVVAQQAAGCRAGAASAHRRAAAW